MRDGKFMDKVRLRFGLTAFGNIRADLGSRTQNLFRQDKFPLFFAQMLAQLNNPQAQFIRFILQNIFSTFRHHLSISNIQDFNLKPCIFHLTPYQRGRPYTARFLRAYTRRRAVSAVQGRSFREKARKNTARRVIRKTSEKIPA